MGKSLRRLLASQSELGPQSKFVFWSATDHAGTEVARIDIVDEGKGQYTVAGAFFEDGDMVYRQRTFHVHADEKPNQMGILVEALEALEGDI